MNFASPQFLWLLLALPPALLAFLWWAGRRRQQLVSAFVHARLLPELTVGISSARETLRAILLTAAVALLILAMARPQWGFTWEEARQKGLDIVVAIDTSKSMLAEDIKPNRLARAKLAALDLMQVAKSDRLGLVAFAGTAFLQCPMTIDDSAFRQSVEMLDVNTLPQGGTAIAEAITAAADAFKEGDSHRILILFTDGEDQDSNAVEAARKAAEAGLRIFTIGIGSPEGELLQVRDAKGRTEYVKDEAGNVVKSKLNEAILQEIATAGNGFYLPMRGAKVIETLYEKGLAPLPKSESDAKLYKHYHEQFHWPLALALGLLMLEIVLPARPREKSTVRNGKPPVLAKAAVLFAILMPLLASASPSSAMREYRAGNFDKALGEYQRLALKNADDPRLALNAGTAAYRGGQLDSAESLLSKAVTAPDLRVQQQAYYNRGNTRFQAGDAAQELEAKKSAWGQSLKDFESAMKLDANDPDARHNYDFVKKKIEELKQQEQQQQKEQDKNKDQKQDQQQQDQQDKQDQNKQDQQKSDDQKQQGKQDQQKDQQKQDQQQKDSEQQKQDKQQQDDKKQDQQKQGQPSKPDDKKNSGEQQQQQQAQDVREMTPEQAQRVLDTMKGDEKVLPLQPVQTKPATRPVKDW